MQGEKQKTSEELEALGKGIARTILRDAAVIVGGALLGALIGFLIAVGVGVPFWSSLKLGALAGTIFGLTVRSLLIPLFDYDSLPASKGSKKH